MGSASLYLFHADAERFQLDRVLPGEDGGVSSIKPESIGQFLDNVFSSDAVFYLASQVISQALPECRETMALLLQKHTRNIKVNNVRCVSHLKAANHEYLAERGLNFMKENTFSGILTLAMAPIKTHLDIPAKDPADHFYVIDTCVVGATKNQACRDYLGKKAVLGPVNLHQMYEIEKYIDASWPGEADSVLKELKATKTREVLSLIDMSEIEGQRVIRIVNGEGELIQFEDWRFLHLIEKHDQQIKLGEFPRFNERNDGVYLKYKEQKKGKVLGMYQAETSRLHVACLSESKPPIEERSIFILDQDYAMSLYVVIKRLRNDKEQYQRLLQQAQVTTGDNPFTKLFQ